MSSSVRNLLLHPRPLRCLAVARRAYATIPTKNPNPTVPMEPSREQAMPLGAFYEAILNTPQPIPDVKPEEPASTVKEHLKEAAGAQAEAEAPKEPAKRGRKPKSKPEPASTATASTAPTAPPAAGQKATAREAAASKSS